jgi:hypothetical protein
MTVGLRVKDEGANVVWDTSSAVGGVVVDSREILPNGTGIFVYPDFTFRAPFLINVLDVTPATVTVDSSLGYPRVTVTATSVVRRFTVAVT